jgi:Family of unknown function (DUF5681)
MSDALPKQAETRPSRDERGRLLPGHTANPKGRPKGVDLRQLAETRAFVEDMSIEDALWDVVKAMIERAKGGDVKAAQLILDRLAMPESRDPLINLQLAQIHATASGEPGPPLPEGEEFSDWVRGLNRVAAQQGLLGGATPAEIVADAVAAVEDEDLDEDYGDEEDDDLDEVD